MSSRRGMFGGLNTGWTEVTMDGRNVRGVMYSPLNKPNADTSLAGMLQDLADIRASSFNVVNVYDLQDNAMKPLLDPILTRCEELASR